MKNIYLVKYGVSKLVATWALPNYDTDAADGVESIHVAANSEAEALATAARYDNGEVEYANMVWPTGTVGVVIE